MHDVYVTPLPTTDPLLLTGVALYNGYLKDVPLKKMFTWWGRRCKLDPPHRLESAPGFKV